MEVPRIGKDYKNRFVGTSNSAGREYSGYEMIIIPAAEV